MKRTLSFSVAALCLAAAAHAQPGGNAARIVVWQPLPGQARDFEEGYKRHLEWHRANGDRWTWRGWMIISGDRTDDFVDGTFFHAWTDFDTPVSPAGDAANNAFNVDPHGDVRSLATYESIPALTDLTPDGLAAPLLTFCYLAVHPGAEVEPALGAALHKTATLPHAVFRPINGTSDYLIILPAEKPSDFAAQAAWLAAVARVPGIERVRTETGRYRADMSYVPGLP